METQVKVGDKIKWNNKEWEVTKIKGGNFYLKTLGLPEQSVNWLKLHEWLDEGKAKKIEASVESKLDTLKIGQSLVTSAIKRYKMSKTYETWDEESTSIGDTDEKGFEYKDVDFDGLWDMANEIREEGSVEPSHSGTADAHTWYTTSDADEDYKTGEKTYYSFHPKGLSTEEAQELQKLIKMSRSEFNAAQPE